MSPTISVALCTHNGERFLEEQLRSILAQSVPPSEIVLADDASTDETVEIARRVMAGRPEVTLIVQRNPVALGVTANFESAIRRCTGDLIALCDQDDIWHPGRLARASREFDTRPELDLVFTNARLVDTRGESLDRTIFDVLEVRAADLAAVHAGAGFSVFIKRNIATGATMMFRRRLLDVALPFAPDWVHDEWLAMLAAATGQLEAIEEELIDYRQHDTNQIGVDYPTLRRKVMRALEPRHGRNARLARRSVQFRDRVESLDSRVTSPVRLAARTKAESETLRASLPSSRLRRVAPVLRAHRRGWYSTYASQGRLDMVRDLLQPHGD